MPCVTHDDAPLLGDLMPWAVAPPRVGRGWPVGPDEGALKARWDVLLKAEGAERAALFEPSRARTPDSAVTQLPGQATDTGRLAHAEGPCPPPVRVLYAPYDEQWLIPDHRLIDAARPELWRVADERQVFLVETPDGLLAGARLPLLGRTRVRPLYRRPGGQEPNLAPGLVEHLADHLTAAPTPEDVLAWILATAAPAATATPAELRVPLTDDPEVWAEGIRRGHRVLWLHRRDGDRPKLPGGSRPYVRAPIPARPQHVHYDSEEQALHLDEGRVSPVPRDAWDFTHGEVRVLEQWIAARTGRGEQGTLSAIGPRAWPQPWTSELLELITVLTLLSELREPFAVEHRIKDLHPAGILPPPPRSRRPASVLDHQEEGPEGQFTLL
ncbi:DNA methyltransferase [Streptomyces niveiscabiei]|uniref:type ISP restriction/modification enzyme n=1 Tax=Streptomyces niveiscabiei TaxID=164115 RepID=UPI0029BEE47B|nr:type ISP restriction/modification enzyme [Streptomyces niveiscabiei]MDX3386895.1 DNA methyltransferase [Streptomyces niveiscabiei]